MLQSKSLFWLVALSALLTFGACNRPYEQVFSTYPNGAKKLVFTVQDGKNGQLIRLGEKQYYENGKLMYEKHFRDDRPTGRWSFYHDNGKLHCAVSFDKNDSIGSDWEFYDRDGEPYATEYDSMVVLQMTADHRPLSVAYHKGEDEMRLQFNDNYTLNARGLVHAGMKAGRWEFFYANGEKMLEATYMDGVENGAYNSYRENGKPYFRGFYINGKRASVWEFYDEEGNLAGRQDFDTH